MTIHRMTCLRTLLYSTTQGSSAHDEIEGDRGLEGFEEVGRSEVVEEFSDLLGVVTEGGTGVGILTEGGGWWHEKRC